MKNTIDRSPGCTLAPRRAVTLRAFTLIELLVVIAIIALLAAILFPVFARARENGRKSSCNSNLKQMGLALQQYSQDYDENFVLNSAGGLQWSDLLQPYIKSNHILVCPSAVSNIWTTGGGRKCAYTLNNFYYNNSTLGQIFEQGSGGPVNISSIEDISGTVFCGDGNGTQFVTGTPTLVLNTYPPRLDSNQADFVALHLQGLNITFLDGHSKWIQPEVLAEKSAAGNYRYLTKIRD